MRKKNEAVRQRLAEYQMREERERAAREERVMEVFEERRNEGRERGEKLVGERE